MEGKPMRILIIEDDPEDCNALNNCAKNREDIEIVATTDSDIEALQYTKEKEPEGIILDLELNNSQKGSIDSIGLLTNLRNLSLKKEPIIIVTTHINSKRTYDILHRNGVDLILYKDQANYSCEHVFNSFINFRIPDAKDEILEKESKKISSLIDNELNLIGVSSNLKGRKYLYDAIFYQIKKDDRDKTTVNQYLTNKYKRPTTTIYNGMQQAIYHAWNMMPLEDIEKYYKARINYETGVPTPMQFISYYADEIKKMI